MKLRQTKEYYAILEAASGITMLLMSFFIMWTGTQSPGNSPPTFWAAIFIIFGVFQLAALYFRDDLVMLRIVTSWIAGTTFFWIAYMNLYTILVVPMITIGAANFISFIDMCDRVTFSKHIEFVDRK